MARNGTASRSGKGTSPKGKKAAPAKKQTTRKKRAPNGQGWGVATQTELLASVREECPNITASQYAERFRLTVEDTLRLQGFAREYLRDYNIKKAAMRLGYPEDSAYTTGQILLYNSYTQLLLAEWVETAKAEAVVSQGAVVAALWKEANRPDVFGSSGSGTRIQALTSLAKILGLGQPKPAAPPPQFMAVGVMLVPSYVAPEDWEAHAREQQKTLKESVMIDAEVIHNPAR